MNVDALPPLNVGLTLDYEYFGVSSTIDADIIFDNVSFWTVDFVLRYEGSIIIEMVQTVNKTSLQNTYNCTQYDKGDGSKLADFQGYLFWIDTDSIVIGENISIESHSSKVMEILDITTPLGTYSVYNVSFSSSTEIIYYYYDITTGFLINVIALIDNLSMYLSDSSTVSEFPSFFIPLILIAIPITLKINKK